MPGEVLAQERADEVGQGVLPGGSPARIRLFLFAGPFRPTFSRSAALDSANRGIAFLTPVHPLVRAVLQRMRSRLYDGWAGDRVAVHPVPPGSGEGWLFTATGRLAADDGQLLEKPLIPVHVP